MKVYALEELVLGDILHEKAVSHPSRTFLKHREGELTYREVDEASERLARGLAARQVRPGDHVAVMLPNSPDIVSLIFALARLGAVAVPVNTEYKGDLLRHVLSSSHASLLVVDEPLLDEIAGVAGPLPHLTAVIVRTQSKFKDGFSSLGKPALPLSDLLEPTRPAPPVAVRHCDLQAIMYTSGTTGPSKGVMVPHAHALTNSLHSMEVMGYAPDETIYCPLPLFHAAALWDGAMSALLAGASLAIVERFSVSRFWDDVHRFDANVVMGVFTMIPILLKAPPSPEDRNHHLRAFYVGKSAQDEALRKRFGVRSVETYTSTEVGIATCSPYGEWRAGSCGRANESCFEVVVVDEMDREVGPGEPGELVVRPKRPFVMTPGYYGFAEATARSFRNLWFHTGDRMYRDADGYFYFVDRIKDCIRRRGENVSAFELEQVLSAHPEVLECAAFGVPSELEEEEIKVAVVAQGSRQLSPQELAAYCQEKLPSFMVPRYIEIVDELPRTPTEKIAKQVLRECGITQGTWDVQDAEAEQQAHP